MNLLRLFALLILTLVFGLTRSLHGEDTGTEGNSVHRMAGIGVIVGGDAAPSTSIHQYLIVRKVLANGPAMSKGLKKDDEIVEIDGEKLAGLKVDFAVNSLLRGEPHTPVKVTVVRPGDSKTFSITIVRNIVPVLAKP